MSPPPVRFSDRLRRYARSGLRRLQQPLLRERAAPPSLAQALDLADPTVSLNPFPHYQALAAAGPVHFLERHGYWIVLSYDGVKQALSQPDHFSNAPYAEIDLNLLSADRPAHTGVRRVITQRFSGQAINVWGESAARLARAPPRERFDVVGDYGLRISRGVAQQMIGFDTQDVDRIVAAGEGQQPLSHLIAALDSAAPRATMFGTLRRELAGSLDDAQIASLIRLLWLAATTTTERVISRAVLRLLQHPDLRQRIEADPILLGPFIEEVMRLHPPEHMLPRLTLAGATLEGVSIPSGQLVQLCVSAANRDPSRFEAPNSLSLDRPPTRHFAFGSGIHNCVGAALARQVVAAAVGRLLEEPGRLRAAEDIGQLGYFHTPTALSPLRLMVEL
jgi:cytochrome P450